MAGSTEDTGIFEEIDLAKDFPDIDDIEGYVEQADYYDRSKSKRTYFYRVGNTMSAIFVPCADVDCEGAYHIRDILELVYGPRKKHLEGALPCCVCTKEKRTGDWCKAKFSIDVKYRSPAEEPKEGTTIPAPEDRYDLY